MPRLKSMSAGKNDTKTKDALDTKSKEQLAIVNLAFDDTEDVNSDNNNAAVLNTNVSDAAMYLNNICSIDNVNSMKQREEFTKELTNKLQLKALTLSKDQREIMNPDGDRSSNTLDVDNMDETDDDKMMGQINENSLHYISDQFDKECIVNDDINQVIDTKLDIQEVIQELKDKISEIMIDVDYPKAKDNDTKVATVDHENAVVHDAGETSDAIEKKENTTDSDFSDYPKLKQSNEISQLPTIVSKDLQVHENVSLSKQDDTSEKTIRKQLSVVDILSRKAFVTDEIINELGNKEKECLLKEVKGTLKDLLRLDKFTSKKSYELAPPDVAENEAREGAHRSSLYSPVPDAELTPAALELWSALPDAIKYDPALENFRQLYEKEKGGGGGGFGGGGTSQHRKRLPAVKSAPHMHELSEPAARPSAAALANGKDHKLHIVDENDNDKPVKQKETLLTKASKWVKLSLIMGVWGFFTVIFMLYNEMEVSVRQTYIAPRDSKAFELANTNGPLSAFLQIEGPFWSELLQEKVSGNVSVHPPMVTLWIERKPNDSSFDVEISEKWYVWLLDDEQLDFSEGEVRSRLLTLDPKKAPDQRYEYALRISTSSDETVPLTLSYKLNPLSESTGVIYAAILLIGLYSLIIFEVINRTLAAVLMSTCALAVLSMVGERPSLPELVSWLDIETLLLLFSMMVLVGIAAETGIFDYLAVFAFKMTKGKIWPLINLLCLLTAVLSTFLDNVTTVLLMTPVTIRLCEVMHLNPLPVLMSMVIFSNIGGTATPVGDPPNVIIASNKGVTQAGIHFTNFTLHMTVGILFVCLQTFLQLRFMYRDVKKLRQSDPKDIQELKQQITLWKRAASTIGHYTGDETVVKNALDGQISKLALELESRQKERDKRAVSKESFPVMLESLQRKYKIRDSKLLIKTAVAISFVVVIFFLHALPEFQRVSLAWTALLGAIMLLILYDKEDIEPVLHRVEWSTLLFFAALFVLMEALAKLGLIAFIGGLTKDIIMSVNKDSRLDVAIVLMLWVSGITSAFVDNIPLTTMMVRVVTSLGNNHELNLPMAPLVWALSFGACLGGNGTLIGASANVVCAGVAEQHGYRITFIEFFKLGFPVMLGQLVVATVYLLICHSAFTWH